LILAFNFLLTSGIVINMIIIWFLVKTKKIELPQKLLISLFICVLFLLINIYASVNEIKLLILISFFISDYLIILIGPILFVYIKSLFNDDKNLMKKNIFHFIIPLTIQLLLFGFFEFDFYLSSLELIEFFIILIFEDLYLLIYAILSYTIFIKYNNAKKLIYSNFKGKDLNWVKYMLIGVIIVTTANIISSLYTYNQPNTELENIILITILVILFISFLGYYGIAQTRVLLPDFLIDSTKNNKNHTTINIDKESIEKYIKTIELILTKNQIFLDENLTLSKLAKLTALNEKKLSAIINKEMNTSFYNLINLYRIDEFKKRIVSDKYNNLTIIGIAYDCGFKSKSTFNRLFKKSTGVSPSDYKNQKISAVASKKTLVNI